MPREVPYSTPGEILLKEFLHPLGITQDRLAKEVGVSLRHIDEIIAGKCAIAVDIALRLSRYFGMSDEFWSGLQIDHDTALARDAVADEWARIHPLQQNEANSSSPPHTP